MTKYFVYVNGLRGPVPQIWHDKPTDGNGKAKEALFMVELPLVEQSLAIESLIKLYPPPVVKE